MSREKIRPRPSFDAILQRIRKVEGNIMDYQIANLLEMKPQSLVGAKHRGSINPRKLISYSARRGLSLKWLMNGDGPMREQDPAGDPILEEPSSDAMPDSQDESLPKGAFSRGAYVSIVEDALGLRPLHSAAIRGHSRIVALLLERGAAVDARDSLGRTPLHYASAGGHDECVRILLGRDADPNARDVKGITPLHLAAKWGNAETTDLLLSAGADPNAVTK